MQTQQIIGCISAMNMYGLLFSQSLLLEIHVVLVWHPIQSNLILGSSPKVVSKVVKEIA